MNFKELVFTVITFYLLFKIFRPSVRVFHYHQRGFDNNQQQQRKPEGKITIDKMPENKASVNKSATDNTEYVDYEEVK